MKGFKKLIDLIKNKIRGTPETPNTDVKINQTNKQLQNRKIMSMFNYGVGGNEIKVDANEAIQEIQENRTLLVSKLTTSDPISPEIVSGLKTVEDVFKHYKPSISVNHETTDGEFVNENFAFKNLADFTPKSLVQNSDFLKNLNIEQEQYNSIIRQLRNNKVLNNMLNDEQSKTAFIDALRAVATELENNQNN